jgi:hyperosmotically inducible protein
MKTNRLLHITGILLLTAASMLWAQDASQNVPAPDNTHANKQDQQSGQATADQQSNNRSDREITQQIRQSIVKDKSLSTYAHNVKVITQNGQVTLRGPVQSEDEKQAVGEKAMAIVGEGNVTNALSVKPKS